MKALTFKQVVEAIDPAYARDEQDRGFLLSQITDDGRLVPGAMCDTLALFVLREIKDMAWGKEGMFTWEELNEAVRALDTAVTQLESVRNVLDNLADVLDDEEE